MKREQRIGDAVHRVVYRTLGRDEPEPRTSLKRLVTQGDVEKALKGEEIQEPSGVLVTPLARQAAGGEKRTLPVSPQLRGPGVTCGQR